MDGVNPWPDCSENRSEPISAIVHVTSAIGAHGRRTIEEQRMMQNEPLELLVDQPIFIGFKVDNTLRQLIDSLNEFEKKYFSKDDSTFLRLCRVGDDLYVGKLVHETLTTDRVEDIRQNVLSILRRVGSQVRAPSAMKIFACSVT